MKILYIIDSLCHGGKERRLVELLKGLNNAEDIQIELVLLTDLIEFEEVHDLNIHIHKIKRIIKKDPLVFFKILKICRKFRPDIINAWGLMPAFYGAPVAKYLKIGFVNSLIVNAPEKIGFKTRMFSKFSFMMSDIIASNSYAGLRSYGLSSDERTRVIYNGFDFKRIRITEDPASVRKKWGINKKYLAVMAAGFRYHKDYMTLIKAARSIIDSGTDMSFMLIGDGPTLKESRELAEGYPDIVFTGRRSDVETLMNSCDIGILSTYTEGISNSVIELMALGKPVVATDGGGTNEIIDDGKNGFLVPRKSPHILEDRIRDLIDDPGLTAEFSVKAVETVKNKFSITKMIEDYMNIYEQMINN